MPNPRRVHSMPRVRASIAAAAALLLLHAAAAARIMSPCHGLQGAVVTEAAPNNVTVLFVHDDVLAMDLFMMARAMVAGQAPVAADAVLVVDCVSGRMGVQFAAFTVGMDCGARELQAAADGVDALHAADWLAVKTARVVRQLAAWRTERRCDAWTLRKPGLTAFIVWLSCAAAAAVRGRRHLN